MVMEKKIWVEILTPKQVMIFGRLVKELHKKGYETIVTTRNYSEVNEVLKSNGIDAIVVGKHGGKTLEGKLSASIERMRKLFQIIKKEKPNLAIYLSSPDAARISFGLGIRSISLNDIPEAVAQSKLTVPISTLVVCPAFIPKSVFVRYGARPEQIVQYNALDPVAWIKNFKPNTEILKKLNLSKKKKIVTFRTEETKAAYLNEKTNGSELFPIIKEVAKRDDVQVVVISRYDQEKFMKKGLKDNVTITNYVGDTLSLLYYSDLFVGAGGTMSLEAALLGTPTISCRNISTYYERYAIKKGLIERAEKGEELKKIEKVLAKNSEYKKKLRKVSKELIKEMEDPIRVLLKSAESLLK